MTALRERQRSTQEEKRKIFYFLSIFYLSFVICHFSERNRADDNAKLKTG